MEQVAGIGLRSASGSRADAARWAAARRWRTRFTWRWCGSRRTTGRRPQETNHSTRSTANTSRSWSMQTRWRSYSSRASRVQTPADAGPTSSAKHAPPDGRLARGKPQRPIAGGRPAVRGPPPTRPASAAACSGGATRWACSRRRAARTRLPRFSARSAASVRRAWAASSGRVGGGDFRLLGRASPSSACGDAGAGSARRPGAWRRTGRPRGLRRRGRGGRRRGRRSRGSRPAAGAGRSSAVPGRRRQIPRKWTAYCGNAGGSFPGGARRGSRRPPSGR